MVSVNSKNNVDSKKSNVIEMHCFELFHKEIAYASQRLHKELSIAKGLASVNGGRANV
ncbi:Uncharacterised protein [Zhongshania aliphaticivorans]|uniref:Uncharacterized protein n=1 Tax=Zhongshania aliphaticivorans TaxID=1470434 RepID=A0A5S9P4F9_9GAMM|nr:Uncharacterised protein [Zhongshania aliphaticivorans]CAA0098276.1 Uncharacterised protein [Zhongshania aliphaticivorans]